MASHTVLLPVSVAALLVVATGLPVSRMIRPSTGKTCSGYEPNLTPYRLEAMHTLTKRLFEHRPVSSEDLSNWVSFRGLIVSELHTDRCTKTSTGGFCCPVCRSGAKSLFCSTTALFNASEGDLEQFATSPFSVATAKAEAVVSLDRDGTNDEDEVTVDLFAVKCDGDVDTEMCSAIVRPRHFLLRFEQRPTSTSFPYANFLFDYSVL